MDKYWPSPDRHGRLLKLIKVTLEKPNLKDVVPAKVRADPSYTCDLYLVVKGNEREVTLWLYAL